MFENIKFPQIVGIGVFDTAIRFDDISETKKRNVTFFEIDLAIEDGGITHINENDEPIRENLLICAKPGYHRSTALPYRCYYIHLAVKSGEIHKILSQAPDFCYPKDPEEFKKIFLSLIGAYNFPDDTSELVIAENILSLCRLIEKETGTIKRSRRLSADLSRPEIIENAVKYISENYAENISLSFLAHSANLSPTYFHKLFRKAVGYTLCEYILDVRIRAAKNLLLTTDKSLVDIASECGFSSQSYFNYAFKKAEKITPNQYRFSKNNSYFSV